MCLPGVYMLSLYHGGYMPPCCIYTLYTPGYTTVHYPSVAPTSVSGPSSDDEALGSGRE